MNRYLQVANTYLWRPRFWVLGGVYLGVMWLAFASVQDAVSVQVHVSMLTACLILCYAGLHVRRQFGGETALLAPDFTMPHLVVWGALSALFWIVVPCGMILAGWWPRGALTLHAVAGILAGAVACWPRAIVSLLALPVLLYWINHIDPEHGSFLNRLVLGDQPALGAALISAAVATHAIAAIALVRLPRRGVSTSDEMALDASFVAADNPRTNWLLAQRDAAAERLGRARRWRDIQRWRVPVAIPLYQFVMPALVVALAGAVGWLMGSPAEWAVMTAMITGFLMLAAPYSVWQPRRRSFNLELMRPVARTDYIRQIALALAWDALEWTLIASLISAGALLLVPITELSEISSVRFVTTYLGVLWGMALLMYGVALATIRSRMWLLLVASAGMTWMFGVPLLFAYVFAPYIRSALSVFGYFSLLSLIVGLSLASSSYRRWLATDST